MADTTQTVDVTLAANTAYEYQLGTAAQHVLITTGASHASVSRIANMPVSPTYQYVPDSNYVGTDTVTVVVSNGPGGNCPDHHGDCKKHHGNCKNKPTDIAPAKTTYTFKFTIGSVVKN